MANEEHLAQLNQGVAAWNQWRAANNSFIPDLTGADLSRMILDGVNLREANLHGANLHRADLRDANLRGATLTNADLTRSHLHSADLRWAGLRGVDLTRTNFTEANLTGAILMETHLIQAGLRWAGLTGVDLTNADLTRARIGWTAVGAVDLSAVHGLDTVVHQGPSTIGIDTLYRSHGNIPEVFLQGAGVPDEMITYIKSLSEQTFRFYSCFISYSSRDDTLAQRLHADLQDKGVRCWFAPEDLKIGDEFRSVIDKSIQVYDRLLLILSEYSVESRWVQKEVETAFEKAGKENRIILFPIQIDEAVIQSKVGWAADIRRQRHIGDFRQWKDHDAYQQALNRLLRDLKTNI